MAQRRMFSPSVVGMDTFLDMPLSSQALYFHLGMYADDDGFINPNKIIRMIGASADELKLLAAKGFVIPFENGVVVIRHWPTNNLVRKDWYQETIYKEEKKSLSRDENNNYLPVTLVNESLTIRPRRLGKVRLVKNTEIASPSASAPFVWDKYLKAMHEHKNRHVQIIAFYFEEKKLTFQVKGQAETAIRRHLRAAKALTPFTDEQLVEGARKAGKDYPEWTLETLIKVLTR